MAHITVLQEEAISALNLQADSVVVDCTLGSGGHSTDIITHLSKAGVYVGFDVDPSAMSAATLGLQGEAAIHLINSNFSEIKQELNKRSLTPTAILADLGWRSEQFETGERGFSFNQDEPLLMTYGNPASYEFTAADIVNDWGEESIADVIYGYGEERAARRIAAAIVAARAEGPIKTSGQLAGIVASAVPAFRRRGKTHPATKTFQAIRIAVNDELGVLKTLLHDGFSILAPGGRLAIITFHSLEDRIVKQYMKDQARDQLGELITKKPITASATELAHNPRARSAKLRVIEKKHVSPN